MAVIGAGYIAVELAGVFQTLGTDTTLLVRRDRPLRSFDTLLVDTLVKEMDKSGLALKPHATTKVNGSGYVCFVQSILAPVYIFRGIFLKCRPGWRKGKDTELILSITVVLRCVPNFLFTYGVRYSVPSSRVCTHEAISCLYNTT